MFRLSLCFCRFDYQLFSPLLQKFCTLCSYILCNPIYLVYLIFFSSYIFQVISFLYPLLICIFLLIICILNLETLPVSNVSEEEAFVIQISHNLQEFGIEVIFDFFEFQAPGDPLPISHHLIGENHSDGGSNWVLKEIDPPTREKGNSFSCISKAKQVVARYKQEVAKYGGEDELKTEIEKKWESMRREKQWKKSLACKLYEERTGKDGGEGMDLLWEIHEVDAARTKGVDKAKVKDEQRAPSKKCKLIRSEDEIGRGDGDGLDEDDEAEAKGQVCCMQALKLSTGKMNMGVRSNNLVKLSRAIKSIRMVMGRVKRLS